MQTSEQINELATALAKAQAAMKAAKKSESNPFYRSRYADLANVMENDRKALSGNGLSVVQGASMADGAVTVTTRLLHSSGQWIEDTARATPKDQGPQAIGATITYLRRYGYQAMVGSTAEEEDDDGETAEGRGGGKKPALELIGNVDEAHNRLVALYKQMIALKVFSQAELDEKKEQAQKAKGNLDSLMDLYEAWSQETKERQK